MVARRRHASAAQPATTIADAQSAEVENELDGLLKRSFRLRTNEALDSVRRAIGTLADFANSSTVKVSPDVIFTIESLIAQIDDQLSQQMNQILHHKEYQKLESAWRGLSYLVENTNISETLKIRVFNVSQEELARNLRRYRGSAWDQSPIFKQIYEQEYGQFGGEPFGCIIGDFEFDHSPMSVSLLTELAKISAAAHCPFISAGSPSLLQMSKWSELGNPRDIGKIFTTPEYASWRRLRESNDSRYLVLTMPRFLARLPYGVKSNPIGEFAFEESIRPGVDDDFCWANSAYAMGVNVNRAFHEYGWCSKIRGIESGGSVEELPAYAFPSDEGGYEFTCPTEVAISDRREQELSDAGFLPLVYRKNSDFAAFIGSCTMHLPTKYEDVDATANSKLSSRLPYIFATCRFAHYLKCIVRDKVGSFRSRDNMQLWLNDWLMSYVDGDPSVSTEATKARRPLAAAEVRVEDVEDDPGYYRAHFFLRPHYQLEGMTVSLRLVTKLPSARKD